MNNPRYVLSLDGVDHILEKVMKSKPYSITVDCFDNCSLVKSLIKIDVLQLKDNKLGMKVPFFVENDVDILKKLSKKVANEIASELLYHKKSISEIISHIDNGYSTERNLYHVLCGYIFDGLMFDYLEQNALVTTSCIHKTGLDYLVILYEDSNKLNAYSNKLLFSYNRLVLNNKGFVSFGDSDGNRNDFYRYYRLNELNYLSKEKHGYINCSKEELIINFEKLANNEKVEKRYVDIYERFDYCKNGKIIVPIYDYQAFKIGNELYKFILPKIEHYLFDALKIIEVENQLSATLHGVRSKDIANEIYHLIFGEVNEILVGKGMVARPPYIKGEGRYFKSFEKGVDQND
ncbi:MAG: hypothetical protein MR210_06365 [Erysipelotrichaceae bacterium]|nr:hypothetical protein [Erysipelotrichaceae bacterium]